MTNIGNVSNRTSLDLFFFLTLFTRCWCFRLYTNITVIIKSKLIQIGPSLLECWPKHYPKERNSIVKLTNY